MKLEKKRGRIGLLAMEESDNVCLSQALLHGVSNMDTRGGHGSPRSTLAGVLEWPFNGLGCVVGCGIGGAKN